MLMKSLSEHSEGLCFIELQKTVEILTKSGCLNGLPRSEQMDMFDLLG